MLSLLTRVCVKQHFGCPACIAVKRQGGGAGDDLDPVHTAVCLPREKLAVRLAEPW